MSSTCDQVAERIALGEPLGEAGEHAATCERCKRLVALPVELGATHREADPVLGFSARMTAGAQHLIGVRRRRRVAAGLAAAVAATTLGVFAMTRHGESQQMATNPSRHEQLPATNPGQLKNDPWEIKSDEDQDVDDDTAWLVQISDTDRSARLATNWREIEKPLLPYRALLRGVSHE